LALGIPQRAARALQSAATTTRLASKKLSGAILQRRRSKDLESAPWADTAATANSWWLVGFLTAG
jgi:hypothetical protein